MRHREINCEEDNVEDNRRRDADKNRAWYFDNVFSATLFAVVAVAHSIALMLSHFKISDGTDQGAGSCDGKPR
jgi:hypothetical protein